MRVITIYEDEREEIQRLLVYSYVVLKGSQIKAN